MAKAELECQAAEKRGEVSTRTLLLAILAALCLSELLGLFVHLGLKPSLHEEVVIELVLHLGIFFPVFYAYILNPLLTRNTQMRLAQQALEDSEQRYRSIFENAREGIFVTTSGGKVQRANPAFVRMLGYACEEEVLALNLPEDLYVNPEDRELFFRAHDHTGVCDGIELQWRRKDGREITVSVYSRSVHDDRAVAGYEGMIIDVTSRKAMERELRRTEQHCRLLADNLKDIIWQMDGDFRFTFISSSVLPIFGWTPEEIAGKHVTELLTPESQQQLAAILAEMQERCRTGAEARPTATNEYRCIRKDGSLFWTEVSATFLFDEGSLTGLVGVTRDISRRREAEERLKESLRQKEKLLKEINHRVKNNLQVMSGLLILQEGTCADPLQVRYLRASQERLAALAMIYHMMADSEDLTTVCFHDYVRSLIANLYASCRVDSSIISADVESNVKTLDIDFAIPCGLILNELVSNALRHAFPGGRSGTVSVLLLDEEKMMTLCVKDDGIGMPAGTFPTASTLGLRLVRLLVGQLEGHMEQHVNTGTEIKITFKAQ